MYLPGTPGDRIIDLRTSRKWNQKELAERIEIAASQLSRIENGETKSISSDILIKLAKEFGVSTDFILGLTTVSVPKSYDISQLGLSEDAVKGLVTKAVDVGILNRLLAHKSFPQLVRLIRIYFEDTAVMGIMGRNQILDMATASLADFMKGNPEQRADAREKLQFIKAQKVGEHEAEMEKIKNAFLSILRDIKSDIDNGKQTQETATAEMIQRIQATLADKPQSEITMDDVAAAVTAAVGQSIPLDEETAEQLQRLTKQLMEQSGKSSGITGGYTVIGDKADVGE